MLALCFSLLVAPPSGYDAAKAALDEGLEVARGGTAEQVVATLPEVLAKFADFPAELAGDSEALALRDLATVTLAFAHITLGDQPAAIQAADESIRTVRQREVPLIRFGSKFVAFYEGRRTELAALGTARIEVDCSDCLVFINEAPAGKLSEPLYLGEYRVAVVEGGQLRSLRVTLERAGEQVKVPPLEAPPPVLVDESGNPSERDNHHQRPAEPRQHDRKLPRWAAITGASIGAAVLVVGGIILSFDGKCPGGLDPVAERPECPNVFNAKPAGYSLIAGGAALFSAFGAVLVVDEVRGRGARPRQVMLQYTLRF